VGEEGQVGLLAAQGVGVETATIILKGSGGSLKVGGGGGARVNGGAGGQGGR
jgi:hypothetical protein